jgi:uncharacterized membrane protein
MARIVYLIVVFILIVLLSYWIYKLVTSSNRERRRQSINKTIHKNKSVADEILKLQNLLEEGIITEKEFEKLKRDLLR